MDSILCGGCWKEARDEADGGKGEGRSGLAQLVPLRSKRSVAGSNAL